MNDLESLFLGTVSRERLFPPGSSVCAAVSGGADSMAMLHLLCRFAGFKRWKVRVLHINHGLRDEANSDSEFVEKTAGELGAAFTAVVPEAGSGGSVESRWSSLRQSVYERQPDSVAVAHNAEDRAETVLLRLVEGAGLRGLGGMDYKGVGPVCRPMLDIRRRDIRNWLTDQGINWLEDRSNLNTDISRNRMRHKVLPVLTECFPEAVQGICRSGSILSGWRDLQDEISCMFQDDEADRVILCGLPDLLCSLALWHMAGRPRSGFQEIEKVSRWLKKGGKGDHILPGGKRIVAGEKVVMIVNRGAGRF